MDNALEKHASAIMRMYKSELADNLAGGPKEFVFLSSLVRCGLGPVVFAETENAGIGLWFAESGDESTTHCDASGDTALEAIHEAMQIIGIQDA